MPDSAEDGGAVSTAQSGDADAPWPLAAGDPRPPLLDSPDEQWASQPACGVEPVPPDPGAGGLSRASGRDRTLQQSRSKGGARTAIPDLEAVLRLSASAPLIQWYPGHIAKAEKALADQLDRVDLVLEVRDARIPLATSHPRLQRWIRGRQHLLVLNRLDMVSPRARQAWSDWFRTHDQSVWWCDARSGTGVRQLQQAAARAGEALNARRTGRGLRPRPVRALMLGFPNVGKSALINRLVGQKVVESGRRAGVTRSLRWVRLGQDLDLLDAPGVLPPRLDDQRAALRLALCDDIGQAAYDTEAVALVFLRLLAALSPHPAAGVAEDLLPRRYGVPWQVPGDLVTGACDSDSGSDCAAPDAELAASHWLQAAADRHTSGDLTRMAQRLLDDFRRGQLGPIALELP